MIAYVDVTGGLALLPSLLALLAIAGSATLAVLLWPVTTLWRFIRQRRQLPGTNNHPAPQPAADLLPQGQ
jgi:hypothetical protein